MARAMSNKLSRRLLFGASNSPSLNEISASATSSMTAAIRRALSITVREVSTISDPASRMERSEWVPPPEASVAVSPPMKLIASGVTPSWSAITWRKLVSWPCPLDCVPTIRSTRSADTFTATRSCGMPTGVST